MDKSQQDFLLRHAWLAIYCACQDAYCDHVYSRWLKSLSFEEMIKRISELNLEHVSKTTPELLSARDLWIETCKKFLKE
jgi:hypothetical protein